MKIDRGVGGKASIGPSSSSGKETSIEKKGGKVKVTAGDQDKIQISQNQDSLAIRVNDSDPLLLSPEESKSLEILSGKGKISVDSSVTIPIGGYQPKSITDLDAKVDPSAGTAHKRETELTAGIKRNSLILELPDVPWTGSREPALRKSAHSDPSAGAEIQSRETQAEPVRQPHAPEIPTPSLATETASLIVANATGSDLLTGSGAIHPAPVHSEIQKASPSNDAPKLEDLTELSSMNVEEKSLFVRRALDRPPVTNVEEVIHSALLSASTPEEFHRIVDTVDGKKLQSLFEGSELQSSWDRMVGAFNRMDLALNPVEAAATQSVFAANGAELQKFLPQREQPLLLQTDLMSSTINLDAMEKRASSYTILENVVRDKQGLALIVPGDLREKVFETLQNSEVSDAERPVLLDGLRREVDLNEYQMREIVSLPMVAAFESAIGELMDLRTTKLKSFEGQVQEAITSYGVESVAVEICRAEEAEFLESIDPEIHLFQKLKTAASEIYNGPANPVVQADALVHALLNEFIPPVRQMSPLIENFARGAILFEDRKIHGALQKLQSFGIPELKEFAFHGLSFLNDLSTIPGIIPEIPYPEIQTLQFFDRLQNGMFSKQIYQFDSTVRKFCELPAIDDSIRLLKQWTTGYRVSNQTNHHKGSVEAAEKLLLSFTEELQAGKSAELTRTIFEMGLQSKLSDVIDSVRMAGDLMVSFRNGHFVQVLATLNQRMAGSPAVLQIIQQALHLTTTGSNFFHALFSREWERPIAQGIRKNPGNKEFTEIHGIFSDALNLFLPLSNIDNLTPFLQYQKQLDVLRDQSVLSDLIHQYQSKAPKIKS